MRKTAGLVAVLVAAATVTLPAAVASAAPSPSPTTTSIDGVEVTTSSAITTEAQLDEFILSSTPKTIQVEAATGDIVSVTEGIAPESRITVHNGCITGQACLVSGQPPLAAWGFAGAGTKTGTWEKRSEWRTGNYTAKAWYAYNGTTVGWGVKSGPNTVIGIDKLVTGVQVTIY